MADYYTFNVVATLVSVGNWVNYDKTNTLQEAYSTRTSLWRSGMDTIKNWCSFASIPEKSAVRVGDNSLIPFNSNLYELLNDINLEQRINI